MRFWNLFASVAVAAAMLLAGGVAEAKKIPKPVKTAQASTPCSLDPNRSHWEQVLVPGVGTVCVPPGLGRFPEHPPGLGGQAPRGWPVSAQ